MSVDEKYMLRCLQLASLGKGLTATNPLVGSVLVHKQQIIGEGYHKQYGMAHAEVNCINSVLKKNKHLIPEATLYVNLEPCNHTGKTPPCSQAILKAGIKKVVVGSVDSNPMVSSQGIAYLKSNQINVEVGLCQEACYRLNRPFFTNHKQKRSYVKLKWAESADGYIGETEKNIAISNTYSNILSHKYRTQIDGIVVGYRTAINDKPKLSARHWVGPQPARIFLDWDCKLPKDILHTDNQRNIVLNRIKTAQQDSIEYVQVDKSAKDITEKLYALNISSILVEGGAKTHNLFIQANCWDEAIIIKNEFKIGKGLKAAELNSGKLINKQSCFTDTILHYSNSEFLR